jgi:hypothetical protein
VLGGNARPFRLVRGAIDAVELGVTSNEEKRRAPIKEGVHSRRAANHLSFNEWLSAGMQCTRGEIDSSAQRAERERGVYQHNVQSKIALPHIMA